MSGKREKDPPFDWVHRFGKKKSVNSILNKHKYKQIPELSTLYRLSTLASEESLLNLNFDSL